MYVCMYVCIHFIQCMILYSLKTDLSRLPKDCCHNIAMRRVLICRNTIIMCKLYQLMSCVSEVPA